VKIDVASMMHGLEVRTPLADVAMFEFATTIPWQVNLRRMPDGAWAGKQLLRQFLRRRFDETFINRPKRGFSVPLAHWFARKGGLRQELNDRFLSGSARVHRYFRPEAIARLIEDHDADIWHRNHSERFWQLLFLENWLEHVHDPAASREVAPLSAAGAT
jgi:asparagine synthase (glutamine-hydrolysing)